MYLFLFSFVYRGMFIYLCYVKRHDFHMVCVLDGKVGSLYLGWRFDGTGAPRALYFLYFFTKSKK